MTLMGSLTSKFPSSFKWNQFKLIRALLHVNLMGGQFDKLATLLADPIMQAIIYEAIVEDALKRD